jgi:sec-independent protein translocase protein TatC
MTGIPEDKELPLEEHLRELRNRLLVVIVVILLLLPLVFIKTPGIIQGFKSTLLPPDVSLIVLNPMEYIYMRILIALAGAAIICMPLILYEVFRFMRPGLYPRERSFFMRVVPVSFFLFVIGGAFSYFLLTPFSVGFLISYSEKVATPMIVLSRFVSFLVFMLLSIGLIFQLPLVISFLVKGRLVTVKELKEKRKYAYPLLLVGAVTLAPDPTPVTPLVIAATLIIVYELSLIFANHLL